MENLVTDRAEQHAREFSAPPAPHYKQDRSPGLVQQDAARMTLYDPWFAGDGGLELSYSANRRIHNPFGFLAKALQ